MEGHEVAHGDLLQGARELNVRLETEERKPADGYAQIVNHHAARKNQQRPHHGMRDETGLVLPAYQARRGRESERDTDDKEEARKDRVREGPAMPRRMRQLAVTFLVRELSVHEDHCGNGRTAKNIAWAITHEMAPTWLVVAAAPVFASVPMDARRGDARGAWTRPTIGRPTSSQETTSRVGPPPWPT